MIKTFKNVTGKGWAQLASALIGVGIGIFLAFGIGLNWLLHPEMAQEFGQAPLSNLLIFRVWAVIFMILGLGVAILLGSFLFAVLKAIYNYQGDN